MVTLAVYARNFVERGLEIKGPVPASFFAGSELLCEAELKEREALMAKSGEQGRRR